jgi:hypothetical protein
MHRWGRASLLAIGIWLATTPALAGLLELDFAVDEGRISFGQSSPLVAGITTDFTGTAKLVLTGVDAQGMLTAPMASATLSSLALQVPLVIGLQPPPAMPSFEFVGTANFTLQRPAMGSFDGASLQLSQNALEVQALGSFPCKGSGCPVGTLLIDQTLRNGIRANFPLSSLDVPRSARLNIGVELDGSLRARFDIFGREVGRRFSVSEPFPVGMLALGGIALGGLAVRRRRAPESLQGKHPELA